MFFNSVSKIPSRFTYVLIWAIDVGTFEMADDSNFLQVIVLVLWFD